MVGGSKIMKKGPESYLKRRNEIREKAAKMRMRKVQKKFTAKVQNDKRVKFKRAERFLAESVHRDRDSVRLLRVKNAIRNSPSTAAASTGNIALVLRLANSKGLTAEVTAILRDQLNLAAAGRAVLVRLDEPTVRALQQVRPYVVYGKPSQGLISELVTKKAVALIDVVATPIVDNTIVEKELGKECGLVCLEDLAHELSTVGEHFDRVRKFLLPFNLKLSKASGNKRGNVKEKITPIVAKLI